MQIYGSNVIRCDPVEDMYRPGSKRLVDVGCMVMAGVIAESGRIGLRRSYGLSTVPKHVPLAVIESTIQPASAIRQLSRFPVPVLLREDQSGSRGNITAVCYT